MVPPLRSLSHGDIRMRRHWYEQWLSAWEQWRGVHRVGCRDRGGFGRSALVQVGVSRDSLPRRLLGGAGHEVFSYGDSYGLGEIACHFAEAAGQKFAGLCRRISGSSSRSAQVPSRSLETTDLLEKTRAEQRASPSGDLRREAAVERQSGTMQMSSVHCEVRWPRPVMSK